MLELEFADSSNSDELELESADSRHSDRLELEFCSSSSSKLLELEKTAVSWVLLDARIFRNFSALLMFTYDIGLA